MNLKEFYEKTEGNYGSVTTRFGGEKLALKFTLKFPDDPSFSQLEKALGEMVQPRHHRQGEEGHQPVLPGAVGGV